MKKVLLFAIAATFVSVVLADDPVPRWRVPLAVPAGYDASRADFTPDGGGGGVIMAQYFKYVNRSNEAHGTPLSLTKSIIWVSSTGAIRQQVTLTIPPPYFPPAFDLFPVSITPRQLVLFAFHGGHPANLKVFQSNGTMTVTDISHLQTRFEIPIQKLDDVGYTSIPGVQVGDFYQVAAVEYYRFKPSPFESGDK